MFLWGATGVILIHFSRKSLVRFLKVFLFIGFDGDFYLCFRLIQLCESCNLWYCLFCDNNSFDVKLYPKTFFGHFCKFWHFVLFDAMLVVLRFKTSSILNVLLRKRGLLEEQNYSYILRHLVDIGKMFRIHTVRFYWTIWLITLEYFCLNNCHVCHNDACWNLSP